MVSKNIKLLKWFNFLYDFRPYSAVAVLYLAQVTHSYALGLAVFSIASVTNSIFNIPTGYFSDRLGRKPTVILGSIASALGLTLYAISHSFVLLAIGGVVNGLAAALMSGNNDALLYDTLKQLDRTDDFPEVHGKAGSMLELGLGTSALLASLLVLHSYRFVMVASIFPQVACVFIALWFVEPVVHAEEISEGLYKHLKESVKVFAQNAKLRNLSIAYVLDYGISETVYDLKPAFTATLWPAWALGIARALDNLFGFLGFHFASKVIKKFTALKTLFSQQIISVLDMLAFAGFPIVVSPFMLSLNSFFYGVGVTANQTLLHHEFTDKQRATMSSLNSFAGNLFYAGVMLVAGFAADKFGVAKALVGLAILSVPAIVMYRNLFRKHGGEVRL